MITPEEPLRLETVGVLRNGRRRYDPASKQRLVEACLQPGVSLAGLALQHGVNANLLRVGGQATTSERGWPAGGADCASLCSGSRAVAVANSICWRDRGLRDGAILCRAADGIDAQRRDAFAGRRRRAVAVGGD